MIGAKPSTATLSSATQSVASHCGARQSNAPDHKQPRPSDGIGFVTQSRHSTPSCAKRRRAGHGIAKPSLAKRRPAMQCTGFYKASADSGHLVRDQTRARYATPGSAKRGYA